MTLTNENLIREAPNHAIGGVQRIYRFADGHGLSAIDSPMAHSYHFAWDIAVLKDVDETGNGGDLDYTTPLTSNVEVFMSDAAANRFIGKARKLFDAAVALAEKE